MKIVNKAKLIKDGFVWEESVKDWIRWNGKAISDSLKQDKMVFFEEYGYNILEQTYRRFGEMDYYSRIHNVKITKK